jgi:sugar/nucleoside kinase (ribokinase family)
VNLTISLAKIFNMKKILGIGNALVDIMTLIPDESVLERFNLPKGSMQLVDMAKSEVIKAFTSDLSRRLSSGGSAANTINGLAMLGAETGFIGSIGKDELGDFYEADMKNAGVKTMLSRRKTATGTAVALISPDSERTFATNLGAAVELDSADINPGDFDDYDILYLEGYQISNRDLVEKACVSAKERNMKIAIDLASYNVVEALLPDFRAIIGTFADIVFANEEEAKVFTGLEPYGALDELARICEVAVVKLGSEGSMIKRGEEIIKIAADNVRVKDTTGAGDLYASGFLYGYAQDLNLELCGQYGSFLAGQVIQILGARMDENQWQEIRKVISGFPK